VEFGARRAAEATAGRDQVPETSHVATQCQCEAGVVGAVSTDDGQRRRRRATVSAGENMSVSTRKSSVSSSAADLLAKLMCVRRKMRLADNVTTV